jgi:Flp pilus assembly protein TadD
MADVQIYGMNPRGHHLTNVALHSISALLLFLLLLRLTGAHWQSFSVAALFALHPLHVESVAWVAERKDVLSAFFCFLSLFFYSCYVTNRKSVLYLLAFGSFVLGLMSKPMLVTLPIVMLLIDFWPLDRYSGAERQGLRLITDKSLALIKEKLPFLLCSFLSGVMTIYAQNKGGAMPSLTAISFWRRSENAMIAYVKYIFKTFWPHDLSVYYPFPVAIPLWQFIGSLLVMLILSAIAIQAGRLCYPYLLVGWFWFIITMVPVIGLIQVGRQSMADRYSYIPTVGLFIMVAWGVPELVKRLRYQRVILTLSFGAAIIVCAAYTWQQLGYWRDSLSLFRHALHVTGNDAFIRQNMGVALQAKGDLDAAACEYRESLKINSENSDAHSNLGLLYFNKGNLEAAIKEYHEALLINPADADVHYNLGLAFYSKGNLEAAIFEYQEALRLVPDHSVAHASLKLARKEENTQKRVSIDMRHK